MWESNLATWFCILRNVFMGSTFLKQITFLVALKGDRVIESQGFIKQLFQFFELCFLHYQYCNGLLIIERINFDSLSNLTKINCKATKKRKFFMNLFTECLLHSSSPTISIIWLECLKTFFLSLARRLLNVNFMIRLQILILFENLFLLFSGPSPKIAFNSLLTRAMIRLTLVNWSQPSFPLRTKTHCQKSPFFYPWKDVQSHASAQSSTYRLYLPQIFKARIHGKLVLYHLTALKRCHQKVEQTKTARRQCPTFFVSWSTKNPKNMGPACTTLETSQQLINKKNRKKIAYKSWAAIKKDSMGSQSVWYECGCFKNWYYFFFALNV